MSTFIEVVAAVLCYQETVLLCRRKTERIFPGFWEFPGGKVEPNETFTQAIARELREELAVSIQQDRFEYFTSNQIEHNDRSYNLHFFTSQIATKPIESTDHDEFRFFNRHELEQFINSTQPIMAADIGPAQQLVKNWAIIFSK